MTDAILQLIDLLRTHRTLVLTGAGMSTESGIPDYRSPESVLRRKGRGPIPYQAFVSCPDARKHYWSRSMLGWPRISAARPNSGHAALADLEKSGCVTGVITQNVDGLHQAAGSREVLELHGTLADVVCLGCGARACRHLTQERLIEANSNWSRASVDIEPDGDAAVDPGDVNGFRVPDCRDCGGVLKPDVVFFGENVPRDRVSHAWAMLEMADALLVLGSSLAVYSGYRFALQAKKSGLPIGIVNLGDTRADHLATVKIEQRLGSALTAISNILR